MSSVEKETNDLYSEGITRTAYPVEVLLQMSSLEFDGDLSDLERPSSIQCGSVHQAFAGLGMDGLTTEESFMSRICPSRVRNTYA